MGRSRSDLAAKAAVPVIVIQDFESGVAFVAGDDESYPPTASKAEHRGQMSKLALVATVKTVPGRRDEYVKHLKPHLQHYFAEPGTLKFEIMLTHDQLD